METAKELVEATAAARENLIDEFAASDGVSDTLVQRIEDLVRAIVKEILSDFEIETEN